MSGRVIQGFFVGGGPRPPRSSCTPVTTQRAAVTAGPARASSVQASRPRGAPSPVHQSAQVTHCLGNDSFEVDPTQIGLARGGGQPLPQVVLAKMEAAFGANFSAVRVHVGPQASRIGAVAFTLGNDLYFAPGRFQPDSVQGQRLIGHELTHVIQQRQGRVRALGSGVTVVQDRALEAEADRLGQRAATQPTRLWGNNPPRLLNGTLQKMGSASPISRRRSSISPAIAGSVRGPLGVGSTIQRLTQITYTQTNNRPGTDTISDVSHRRNIHNQTHRNIVAYLCGWNSYNHAQANGCLICNHYVAYSKIREAVTDRLEAAPGTLNAAVAWLNGLVLAPAAVVTVHSTLFPAHQNPWNQPLGAMPGINILPHHIALGVNYYDEEVVAEEVDDLIYNLANDPRNLFYWPTSTGQNAAGIDNPTGPLAHTQLATIRARLTAYRVFLQGLGLAV
jgi:hypothetical protein